MMGDAVFDGRESITVSPTVVTLERDFADEIRRIGFHPFVLVRIGHNAASKHSVYCRTQDQVPEFLDAIARTPRFAESLLVRGIERALRREIYDAGDLL